MADSLTPVQVPDVKSPVHVCFRRTLIGTITFTRLPLRGKSEFDLLCDLLQAAPLIVNPVARVKMTSDSWPRVNALYRHVNGTKEYRLLAPPRESWVEKKHSFCIDCSKINISDNLERISFPVIDFPLGAVADLSIFKTHPYGAPTVEFTDIKGVEFFSNTDLHPFLFAIFDDTVRPFFGRVQMPMPKELLWNILSYCYVHDNGFTCVLDMSLAVGSLEFVWKAAYEARIQEEKRAFEAEQSADKKIAQAVALVKEQSKQLDTRVKHATRTLVRQIRRGPVKRQMAEVCIDLTGDPDEDTDSDDDCRPLTSLLSNKKA